MGTTQRKQGSRMGQLAQLLAAAAMMGGSPGSSPMLRSYSGNGMYIPRKHTVQSYRSQQRAAKQRRKSR